MLTRIDLWIGKHLFVPIIIRVCQAAGIGQFRFARYASAAGWMMMIAEGPHRPGWVMFVFFSLSACLSVLQAALIPDDPCEPTTWLRWMWLALAPVVVLTSALAVFDPVSLGFNLAVLAAEYALTIKTIPPRETERKRALATNLRRTR